MAPPEDMQSGAILPEPVLPSPPDVSPGSASGTSWAIPRLDRQAGDAGR
jgi:hypothetical protein